MQIRAFILLSGSVRKTEFQNAIDRSVLAVPLRPSRTLGEYWVDKVESLAAALPQERLSVRVVVDGTTPRPVLPEPASAIALSIEEDPFEFRGTAGVLKDLARDYDEDDWVLVANASQPPLGGLKGEFRRLEEARGAARVLIDGRRSPTGLVLLRVGCLASVAEVGYVDLKEQALPMIAEDEWVSAVETEERFLDPIRNRATYLSAVRVLALGPEAADDPYREDWESAFSIVEEGAVVDPGARIHDSVVLAGSVVEEGAVVARSVVCPGRTVRRAEMVVDRTVWTGRAED